MNFSGFSHKLEDPPVKMSKKREIVVSNTIEISRPSEPVIIPIESILEKAPDFNKDFFRIKHKTTRFEPLDIPSQIRLIPGVTGGKEELVFQLDLGPKETVTVDLQYNTEGTDLPDYPARTQSFRTWYRDGSNSAWENEICGYRYYFGKIDFFGKSFPHLCLHKLASDSYHSERYWGHNPFDVRTTSGLGGIGLVMDDKLKKCYGAPGEVPYTYTYQAHGGGPVCAGVTVRTNDPAPNDFLVEASATLFNNRYENIYRATTGHEDAYIAPGIRKFENEHVTLDEDAGYLLAWGMPVEVYGTTGIAAVWNPVQFRGLYDTEDVRFPELKPGSDGMVTYLTLGIWHRHSSDQPKTMDHFINLVNELSLSFRNPVKVEIK